MCKEHWDMVPKSKQEAVYREYRKGQCNLKPMPSPQWFDAADAAIYAVRIIELNKITKELKSRIATLERQSEIQTSVNGQMGLHIKALEQQLAQARGKNIKLENDIQRLIHNHYHAPIAPPGAQ